MAQPGGFSIDPALLPTLNYTGPAQEDQSKHGPLTSGLVRGVLDNLGGIGGAVVAGAGKLVGSQGIENAGNAIEQYTAAAAPTYNRPDLDVAPWQQGGAHVAPWLEYQAAKQVPLMAAYLLGGKGLTKAGVEAPEFLQNIGARVPRVLGGGGLRAGMDEAAQAGAREAGKSFAQTALGAELVGLPIAAGSMYQEAQNKPGGATREDAVKSAVMSPFYAALDAIEPAEVAGLAKRGLAGGLLKRVATAGLVGTAAEVVQEGVQTAMEQSFRTDLTPQQKMSNIVTAALTGGAIGGLFGGGAAALGGNHDGSLRAVKNVDPAQLGTSDLKGVIDQIIYKENNTPHSAVPQDQPTSVEEPQLDLQPPVNALPAGTQPDLFNNSYQQLQARNVSASNTDVNAQPETVEPDAGAPGGTSSAPVSVPDIKELFKGVSPAARKAYAGATSIADIAKINNDLLEAGTSAKGHLLIAERLGVNLNEPAAPVETQEQGIQTEAGAATPLVNGNQTTTTAPAAPANLEGGDLSAPAKLSNKDLLQALAENNPKEVEADLPAVAAAALTDGAPQFNLKRRIDDRVQQEAVRRGLLAPVAGEENSHTPVYDYTDKARQMMQRNYNETIPTEDTTNAAQARGFKGVDVSQFDRGAQAFVKGVAMQKLADPAWQAGHKWAEHLNGAPVPHAETQKTLEDLGDTMRQAQTDNEIKAQQFNQRIDALGLSTTTHPSEVAQLKQLAANPETSSEHLERAIATVESGKSLFTQPEPGPNEPLKTEPLDRNQIIRQRERQRAAGEAAQTQLLNRVASSQTKADMTQTRDEFVASERRKQALRNELHRIFDEMDAEEAAKASEPRELKPDRNGVLNTSPYFFKDGTAFVTHEDRSNASKIISTALDNPGDAKAVVQEIINQGGAVGAMAKRFAKYIPQDVKVQMLLTSELEDVGRQMGWSGPPAAFYDHDSRTVALGVKIAHPSMILHEFMHAVIGEHIYNRTAIGEKIQDAFNRFKKYAPQDDYALTNANEFMAEFLSRQQVRDYVRDIAATHPDARGNIFQRMWQAIRTALGNPPIDHVERILQLAEAAGANNLGPKTVGLMSPMLVNEHSKAAIGGIAKLADEHINTDGKRGIVRRSMLGWAGEKSIEEFYGKNFTIPEGNGVEERRSAMGSKRAMVSHMARPVVDLKDRMDHLDRHEAKAAEDMRSLMRLTEYGLNPFRTWDQQIDEVKEANNPNLKAILSEAQAKVRSLTGKGQIQLYHDARALNDISLIRNRVIALHQDVVADKLTGANIPIFQTAPMDDYMSKVASQDMDIAQTRDFWRKSLLDRLSALEAYLGAKVSAADNLKGREKNDVLQRADALSKSAEGLHQMLKTIGDVPNFHLGRDGDYFVDMKIRTLQDGTVDPKALAAASEALEEFGAAISSEGNQDHIYIRIKDQLAQKNLLDAAYKLQQRGIVRKNDPGAKDEEARSAIKAGKRANDRVRNPAAARWLSGFEQRIRGDDHLSADDKKRLIEEARSAALDVMPDNSLMKVMTQRRAVPGYDPDMFKNFFTRQKIAIDADAGMATAPKITDAFGKMRLAVDRAQQAHTDDVSINTRAGMTEVVDELSRRDRERADSQRTPVIDAVRQATNTWALGLSPAFVAMQLIQIPQLVVPRMGAKFGFVKTAQAMSGSTKQALAIMREVYKEGRAVGVSRSFDAVISLSALKRAGVPESAAHYLMHLANLGVLDIGGQARELTHAVDGRAESPLNNIQRFAAAPGYYAETFSRVLTALAHNKLNGETDAFKSAQMAAPFIEDTLWNYAQDMQGRMFGKKGIFGAYTPLATQFMTYTSQLVQRLYLDMHAAIAGEDAQTRSEARKFLLGHLAATTVFAGSLGLPFATLFAAAFDKLKDSVDGDDEPSDIQAAYRNWLADMFGKDAGEMIARGASRGIGIDISHRVGEQDIFPFSRFLSDRRSFKDSLKDLEARGWGAPASFASQALVGGESIMNGNVIDGMAQLMPVGLGSLVKSYRMTSQGYVDANGKQLPISTPSTNAILSQAIGFAPSQQAEYSEARQDQSVRKGIIARQAGNLRNQLADAFMSQDQDSARDLIKQAQQFDTVNPAFAVMPTIEGTIRQRMRQQALARMSGAPLGVSMKDLAGRQATRYANIDSAQQ